ncbi:MAG: radical SAM protein [Deltaproteobacteria bacterium]|nr:radical SAM protein [Deltaproteobacteria bacterium]
MRPLIIPIFISHAGCPHKCLFCDQERITARTHHLPGPQEVRKTLDAAIDTPGFDRNRNAELAFYGGTFTGLSKTRMESLLKAAAPYVRSGMVQSIRISTRPDSLDDERLTILKAYGVSTVELGAQSMNDRVLALSQRGHSAEDTIRAVRMLKDHGLKVGIQLMPGLPGDSRKEFSATTKKVLALKPHMVRLYPALVIKGTGLARMHSEGAYQPFSLEEAVNLCVENVLLFEGNGIPVIRIGLMSSPSLLEKGRIVSGPWHPAFGFLVRSAIHLRGITLDLPIPGNVEQIRIFTPMREIPLVRGYKNQGIRKIEQITGARVMGVVPDDTVPMGSIRLEMI